MSNSVKEGYSPLFDIKSFEAENVASNQISSNTRTIADNGDSSVLSWNLPAMEKEDDTALKEDTKTRMARLEREAYEKGFAQGQKDGLDLEKSKLEEMGRQYEALLKELRDLKIKIYSETEGEMLQLILLIVKKIIGEEIETSDETIGHTIRSAAKFLTDKRKVRIIINPEDMEEVKKMLPDLSKLTKGGHFQLTEDNGVGKGGCILETGFGRINATIEDQFKELDELIKKEYLISKGGMA